MKVRKLLTLLLILIAFVNFSGCSSGIEIGSIGDNTSNSTTMSYSFFSGTKTRKITVEKDKPVNVSCDIETKRGSLALSITDEDGNSSYKGTDLETNSFIVTLVEEGSYTLLVKARNHKGGFHISW